MTTRYQRNGRLVDASEALDEDGILRDGYTITVPMMLRDALTPLQRSVAEHSLELHDGSGSRDAVFHRPGFIVADNAAMRDAKQEAYDEYKRDLTSAWRRGPVRDAEGYPASAEGSACMVTGYEYREFFGSRGHVRGGTCVPDQLLGDARKVTQRDPRGRVMSTWEEEEEDALTRDGMTLDAIEREHQQRMARCYADHDAWLREQWRTP
jgi:hypothetical protein